jgi:hypothetical protein
MSKLEFPELVKLLSELQPANARSDPGLTSSELRAELNVNEKKMAKILKQGVMSGAIKIGRRWVDKDWDGQGRWYRVYYLTEKEG